MAKIQIIFLFSVCIAVVYSKRFTKVQDDKNGEGVCIFNGKNYKPDDEWTDNECKKWRCATGKNKNEMLMHGETCEDIVGPNGKICKVKTTLGKNFPECCTDICDENQSERDRAREEERRNRDEERRHRDEERRNRDEERRNRDEERRNRHRGRPQPQPIEPQPTQSQPADPQTPQPTPSQDKSSANKPL